MIEIKNVSKVYETGTTALKNIDLTIKNGEFVFIVGRSGSGKSTLLKLMTKELEPTSGEIIFNDTSLSSMPRRKVPMYRRRLGVVFQDFRLLRDRTVYENVAFAQLIAGADTSEIREHTTDVLRMTGLSSKYKFFPGQLSGGEQQRVSIARALVNRPELLLADEPTGNLDQDNTDGIMNLLTEINHAGTTVIVITHDLEMVQKMKKRVVTMAHGVIVSDVDPHEGNEIKVFAPKKSDISAAPSDADTASEVGDSDSAGASYTDTVSEVEAAVAADTVNYMNYSDNVGTSYNSKDGKAAVRTRRVPRTRRRKEGDR